MPAPTLQTYLFDAPAIHRAVSLRPSQGCQHGSGQADFENGIH